jgi:acyl transferase domain-containing protein/acyl carrier protein/nucleoside-diphosphate-sugar epimerase
MTDSIAVVGVGVLYPGSAGAQSFWRNIVAGRDFMTDIPADHWLTEDYYDPDPGKPGKTYAKRGAFLPPVDFDPIEHGLPPRQLSTTDTAQLLALGVAQQVLEDAASVRLGKVDKRNISVILGVASATELVGQMAGLIQRPNWVKGLRDAGLSEEQVQAACDRIEATYPAWDESTFPGLLGNVVAGRIANRLDLGGTNCVVDAACASSLGAVAMAAQELQLGHSDMVITGGVDALNDIFMFMCFSKTPALSPTGHCRPFAESADGTMLGEGLGMLALRRLADAERDGDHIYAVLRGIGSSSDGRAKSIYAPRSEGQELAIRRAYEGLDYGPAEVGLVEAHGTATKAGDLAEFDGLRRAFAEVPGKQVCALGSIKSQIGHTKAAAGAASLFKAVMALHHKVLPPTIKVDRPNAKLDIASSPFYLNTRTRPWIAPAGAPRRAAVSSFGFGGSNFHVTLEEYRGPQAKRIATLPVHLLLLAADSRERLIARLGEVGDALASGSPEAIVRASQSAFDARAPHRLAILGADAAALCSNVAAAADLIGKAGNKPASLPNRLHYGAGGERPKVAFLFPGQGSQYVGMGGDLAVEFDAARRVWDEAAAVEMGGLCRLHDVVFPVPVFSDEERQAQADMLIRTEWAQPAIGAASLSMLRLLDTLGLHADAVAGHSYGEITALHAAGALPGVSDFLAVSRRRGELMAEAAGGDGAMLAMHASAERIQALIDDKRVEGVTLANLNSPSQIVVAGATAAITAFQPIAEASGLACRRLAVATAFHTDIVAGSVAPLAAFLEGVDFAAPALPVYGNSAAQPYPNDPTAIRAMLARQLAEPVRFAAMVDRMHGDGIRLFVEVGPGATLKGLVSDCLAGRDHAAIALDSRKADGRAALFDALGQISVHGVPLDYAALWASFAGAEEGPPRRSIATVKLTGANYGKPYPPKEGAAGRTPPNPALPTTNVPAPAPNNIVPAVASAPSISAPNLQDPIMPARPDAAPAPFAVPGAAPASDAAWGAFQVMQASMLEAQKAFTQTLGDSHQAYLHASEATMLQLGGIAPALRPIPMPTQPPPVMPLPVMAAPTPLPAPVAPPPVVAVPSALDPAALLLEVVAEKTGYPVEMLTLDMELEAGLGIDSIKRVQILSALQEKLPQLADVDTSALAALGTLGEIVALASRMDGPAIVAVAASPVMDATALLLEVVAEKTGYPVEMLALDMELEAGLGIDSIKRVQILSALQEKLPHLADVDTNVLAALNTLGEIVALAEGGGLVAAVPRRAQAAEKPVSGTLERCVVEWASSPTSGLLTPGLIGADPLWIAGARPDLAAALAEALHKIGVRAEATETLPEGARAAILLALGADKEADPLLRNEQAFAALKPCAAAMATGGLLVMVQGMEPWSAGVGAIAKTAGLEWPAASVRSIEVEVGDRSPEALAAVLLEELMAGGAQIEVALMADGRRVAPRLRVEQAPLSIPVAPPGDGVLLVSGGARGVTAACLAELLAQRPQRVAILGRTTQWEEPTELRGLNDDADLKRALLRRHQFGGTTPNPQQIGAEVQAILAARELRANLDRFAALGAEVRYHPVDIGDAAAVSEAVAAIRRELGPITGIVHAAGVLADKAIAQKTLPQFRAVMRTKAEGLRNLLEATRDDVLTHIVCFSSIAAWRGNVGQSDYAAANQVLNRICRQERERRGAACLVKAIGWGPWSGGMVDAGLAELFASRGVPLIPVADGARFFADEYLGRHGDVVELVFGAGIEAFAATPQPTAAAAFHARFHRSTHAYIDSHIIRSNIVVPMVAAVDLARRTVARWLGGTAIAAVEGIEVLAGMTLQAFEGEGDVFRLDCAPPDATGRVAVRISDAAGRLCYRMQVVPGDAALSDDGPVLPPLDAWPDGKPIYDGRLFHGAELQVLEAIEGMCSAGARGVLKPGESPSIAAAGLAVDMLDGGIQLSVLWGHEKRQAESLPTGVRRLALAEDWDRTASVRCEAQCTGSGALSTRWTLRFRDEGGRLIGVMEGLELHDLPPATA